jgi:phage gp36-like protein
MIFIFDEDIKKQCTVADLDVLAQSDEDVKDSAEKSAISFFRGYLKRYDVDTIFTELSELPEPDTRNASLVMFLIDYFLYILYSAQPDRLIPDIRVKRYEDAVHWLEGIQKGNVSPDLPTVDSEDETDINSTFKYGSEPRVSTTW